MRLTVDRLRHAQFARAMPVLDVDALGAAVETEPTRRGATVALLVLVTAPLAVGVWVAAHLSAGIPFLH